MRERRGKIFTRQKPKIIHFKNNNNTKYRVVFKLKYGAICVMTGIGRVLPMK